MMSFDNDYSQQNSKFPDDKTRPYFISKTQLGKVFCVDMASTNNPVSFW